MAFYTAGALLFGFILDALIGDPDGWPHMVRFMGGLISLLERRLYPIKNKRLGGTLLVIITLLIVGGVSWAALFAAWRLSPWAYFALALLLCWQCLALKSLKRESGRVYKALEEGDLAGARKAVSMIVGRDTEWLDEAGVTRAAVETVAENASDGVIAPLLFLALLGPVGGCLYKAVNTMDSMIGYKNERYLNFGRAAARLDDVVNFIPARLSALLMICACPLCGMDGKNALRIWKRDRRNHASPNSAQTEAVMAGTLNVRLAGSAYYFGRLVEKPFIGEDIRPMEHRDILRSHRLLTAASLLMLMLAIMIRGGILYAAL